MTPSCTARRGSPQLWAASSSSPSWWTSWATCWSSSPCTATRSSGTQVRSSRRCVCSVCVCVCETVMIKRKKVSARGDRAVRASLKSVSSEKKKHKTNEEEIRVIKKSGGARSCAASKAARFYELKQVHIQTLCLSVAALFVNETFFFYR